MYTQRFLLSDLSDKIVTAFGLSPKWSKWCIDRLRMTLYQTEEGILSSFDGSALSAGAIQGAYNSNLHGVVYRNLETPYRCNNVASWSDLGKSGTGEFIMQESINAACNQLLGRIELKRFSQYHLWVTQYELCLDSVCDTRAEQHSLYSSIKELLTESLKDLYPVVIEEDQSPEPYVQFQKQPGHVVEILKLYCTTQAGGGSMLRFEYAWDCSGKNQPHTESISIPLETHYKGGNKIILCKHMGWKSLEDELLETILSKGSKSLEPVMERVINYMDIQKERAS